MLLVCFIADWRARHMADTGIRLPVLSEFFVRYNHTYMITYNHTKVLREKGNIVIFEKVWQHGIFYKKRRFILHFLTYSSQAMVFLITDNHDY